VSLAYLKKQTYGIGFSPEKIVLDMPRMNIHLRIEYEVDEKMRQIMSL